MKVAKREFVALITGCLAGLLFTTAVAEQPNKPQGAKIVRIDDGTSSGQCIQQEDKLTVTFRGGTLEKQSKWLGLIQDTELGMTFTTSLSGSSGDDTKTASFARVVKESVTEYHPGSISLAQEQSLLSKFGLKTGANTFTVVDLEIGIVRTRGQSVGAKILLGAVAGTKSLALPKDPFTTAFGVATSYVNSVFTPLLDQAAADKEATSAHITMNIDSANCSQDDERTGTKMIVFAADKPASGAYVDIDNINQYCWQVQLLPSVSVNYAAMPNAGGCSSVTSYKAMHNSFLAFVVNSLSTESPKPDAALVSKLSTTRAERRTPDFSSLTRILQENGAKQTTAQGLAGALLGGTPVENLSRAYGVSDRAISTYVEAISRCKSNGMGLERCLK